MQIKPLQFDNIIFVTLNDQPLLQLVRFPWAPLRTQAISVFVLDPALLVHLQLIWARVCNPSPSTWLYRRLKLSYVRTAYTEYWILASKHYLTLSRHSISSQSPRCLFSFELHRCVINFSQTTKIQTTKCVRFPPTLPVFLHSLYVSSLLQYQWRCATFKQSTNIGLRVWIGSYLHHRSREQSCSVQYHCWRRLHQIKQPILQVTYLALGQRVSQAVPSLPPWYLSSLLTKQDTSLVTFVKIHLS